MCAETRVTRNQLAHPHPHPHTHTGCAQNTHTQLHVPTQKNTHTLYTQICTHTKYLHTKYVHTQSIYIQNMHTHKVSTHKYAHTRATSNYLPPSWVQLLYGLSDIQHFIVRSLCALATSQWDGGLKGCALATSQWDGGLTGCALATSQWDGGLTGYQLRGGSGRGREGQVLRRVGRDGRAENKTESRSKNRIQKDKRKLCKQYGVICSRSTTWYVHSLYAVPL